MQQHTMVSVTLLGWLFGFGSSGCGNASPAPSGSTPAASAIPVASGDHSVRELTVSTPANLPSCNRECDNTVVYVASTKSPPVQPERPVQWDSLVRQAR